MQKAVIDILSITDLSGNTEMLTDHGVVTRSRKINGERQISFDVTPTDGNAHAIDLVAVESIVEFDCEPYVIKTCEVSSLGDSYVKSVDATHKFYVDLINSQQPEIRNGSMTFLNALAFIFNGTNYTYTTTSSFNAQRFENFGNTNRLSLLNTVLQRYKAEFKVEGNLVTFSAEIGAKTDYQFRYGYNVEAIKETYNTQNLATKISGRGANTGTDENPKYITAEYTSPNASIFGIIEAEPYSNENYTSVETLTEALKEQLQDTPEFSVTVDFAELEEQGVGVINEGDYVHTIYEPINDLYLYTRVMEIVEEFDEDLTLLSRQVTLANFAEDYAMTQLQATAKAMRAIVDDGGKIKFDALDAAVINATRALQSAQTQLKFENGILAIDPTNPDKLVLFNSAGIGVSKDGGVTFPEAITGDGINTSLLTAGVINANLVSIANNKVELNSEGLYVYKNGVVGAALDEGNLVFYDQTNGQQIGIFAATSWEQTNSLGISMNVEQNRFITFGRYESADLGYISMLVLNPGAIAGLPTGIINNLPIRANEDIWLGNRALRLGENNTHNHSAIWHGADDNAIIASYTGIRLGYLTSGGTVNNRLTVDENSVDIWQDLDMHGWKILNAGDIYSNGVAVTSDVNKKKNITDYTKSVLDEIKAMQPKQYHLLDDDDSELKRLGVILQEAPADVVDPRGAIDSYAYSTFILKGLQESVQIIEEQSQTIETQKQEIDALKTQMASVLERLDALETQNGEPSA